MSRIDLGKDGGVVMNVNLHPDEPQWLRDLAVELVPDRARR
jgi:hypothetical protein